MNPIFPITPIDAGTATKAAISLDLNKAFASMLESYQHSHWMVENNPYGLSEAEVASALGVDAMAMLRDIGLIAEVLNLMQPGTIPTVGPYGISE